MALNENALVSLEEMKVFLKIPPLITSEDSLIENFINEISSLIERYCYRKFISKEYTEFYDGGNYSILLNNWPVSLLSSVYVDNDRVFDNSSLLEESSYGLFLDAFCEAFILEKFDGKFDRGRKNIKVVYTAGYVFSDIPNDLKLACKIGVAFYFNKQQQDDFNHAVKSKGDENITLIQGLPENCTLILDNYKRMQTFE